MLTPMDIDRKEFKKSFRGYNVEEVEAFLMEINESYEELYLEHQEAKEQITRLSEAVAQYKAMEETLKNGLTVAEQDGEDMKNAARAEAERFLREAKVQADEEIALLSYQYEQMKHSVEVYRAKVVSLLHAQLDIIKEYGEAEPVPQPEPKVEMSEKKTVPLEEQNTVEIPAIHEGEDGTFSSQEEE